MKGSEKVCAVIVILLKVTDCLIGTIHFQVTQIVYQKQIPKHLHGLFFKYFKETVIKLQTCMVHRDHEVLFLSRCFRSLQILYKDYT